MTPSWLIPADGRRALKDQNENIENILWLSSSESTSTADESHSVG